MVGYPLAIGYGYRWMAHGERAIGAVGWGLFVGLCHPVAGVSAGVALAAMLPVALVEQQDRAVHAPRLRYLWPVARLVVLGVLYVIGAAPAWVQVIVDYEAFGGFPHRVKGEDGPGFEGLQTWLRNGHFLDDGRVPPRVLTALLVPSLVLSIFFFWLRRWRFLVGLWFSGFAFAYIIAAGRSLKTADDLFPAVRVLGALQFTLTMVIGAACMGGVVAGVRALEPFRPAWVARLCQGALAFVIGLVLIAVSVHAAGLHHDRVKIAEDYERIHRRELDPLLAAMKKAGPGRFQNRGTTNDKAPGVENHWFIILPHVYAGRDQLVTYGAAGLQSSTNFVYLWETPGPIRSAWQYDAPLILTNKLRGPDIGGTVLASTEHFELRELPSPGLVSAAQIVGEIPPGSRKQMREVVLRWQRTDQPMHEQLLAWPGSGIAGPPPDGDVVEIKRGRSQIMFKAQVRTRTTYLVRESWHPRWVATIDGKPAPIRRVTPDMMALDLEPGDHTAVLRFERPLWTWLLWLFVPFAMLAGWFAERVGRWLVGRRGGRA
jgi:hypothetical protein